MRHSSPIVLEALGYDDLGNCPALLHPDDKKRIEGELPNGRYGLSGVPRAGGDSPCKCGFILYHHPQVQGALYLTRTCEGIVKL